MCTVYFTFHLKSAFVLNNAAVRRFILLCPFAYRVPKLECAITCMACIQ
jgi:hypothetical protein